MKKIVFIFSLISILFPITVLAEEEFTNYIIRDISSGRVFLEKASNVKKLPASTTKVMTAIVGIENSNLSDVVTVGDEILTMDGTNLYLEVGENILMQDLLYGLILRSGNDASMVIARHAGGSISNFVKLMNEKARSLGLTNTIFNNPSGLDDNEKNYSTVNDLSLIYSYAYKNKTFREIVSTESYKTESDKKSYYFKNRMEMLNMYDKCTGGKTGYTPDAGRLLISSASNNDLDLVMVSIGNDYGYNFHINNFEEVFSKYKNYKILDKDNFKVDSTLNGKLYINNSFSYPLTNEELSKVSKKVIFNSNKKGVVGEVLIYLDDELIHKEDVYLRLYENSFWDKLVNFFKNLT